jgi:hypothetical protein
VRRNGWLALCFALQLLDLGVQVQAGPFPIPETQGNTKPMRYTLAGKAVSRTEFEAVLATLKKMADTQLVGESGNAKGEVGALGRYKAEDETHQVYWVKVDGAERSIEKIVGNDARPDSQWKVTWTVNVTVDHGDGVSRGFEESIVTLSPTEARRVSRAAVDGRTTENVVDLSPVADDARNALREALVKLANLEGCYSITPLVDDEGSRHETLEVVIGSRRQVFSLRQGKRAPAAPPMLKHAYELITQAAKR